MRQVSVCFLYVALAVASVVGCASPPHGQPDYKYVHAPKGCYAYEGSRQRNVVLRPDLEASLLTQIARVELQTPACWFETGKDQLTVKLGDECFAHGEAQFVHGREGWKLAHAEIHNVIC